MQRTIWQNYDINEEDFQEYFDEFGIDDEYEKFMTANQINDEYLEDERANLNIELPEDIVCIADIGLWNGRRHGYKLLKSNNLADCLKFESSCEYAEWYVDSHSNLRSRQTHHDGTHYVLYRMWKEGLSETQKENFLEKIYVGKASRKDISRYTKRLGDAVAQVYGWNKMAS